MEIDGDKQEESFEELREDLKISSNEPKPRFPAFISTRHPYRSLAFIRHKQTMRFVFFAVHVEGATKIDSGIISLDFDFIDQGSDSIMRNSISKPPRQFGLSYEASIEITTSKSSCQKSCF